jgi:3-oxo-5alpha-steroid 4-dehydrogenase
MARPGSVRPLLADEVESWDVETDVIVVGSGIAGVCAALGSLAEGAETLVLERGGGPEGTCGGILYLGGGTPMQLAMGYEDTADEMYTFLLASLGPGVDETKLRVYCDESLDHYDWLVANGVPLITGADGEGTPLGTPDEDGFVQVGLQEYAGGGLVWTGGENAYPFDDLVRAAPRGHIPRDPEEKEDLFEGAVLKAMIKSATASGMNVRFDTGVERLIVDSAGAVVGVDARSFGTPVRVRARRGVVLASGGFVYDDAMLSEHVPTMAIGAAKLGHGGQDGLGMRAAQVLGADTIHMDTADVTLVSTPLRSFVKGLLVNDLGRRFINEDTYYGRLGHAAIFDQGGNVYLVVDDAIFKESSWMRPAWAADTAAELETEIGLPAGSLQTTIDYYNEHAAAGDDPVFHKRSRWVQPLTPPYAVLDMRHASMPIAGFTLGGLRTTVAGEVLDVDASPIAGLYAAGRVTSGLAVHGYCSGISLGDGSFFGRRAGQSAARRDG